MGFWRGLGNVVSGGAIDRNEAKSIVSEANRSMESAENDREEARDSTNERLSGYGKKHLEIMSGVTREFGELFSKLEKFEQGKMNQQVLLADMPDIDIESMKQVSIKASELLSGTGAAAAGGVLAYTGAMDLAGLIGTASTGTAIGALSGVAATNATLAWLGGGTLAAGGFGMAGGMMVLGGIAFAPLALITGGVLASN